MIFAERMNAFVPGIFQILDAKQKALKAQGKEIFNLSVGTPDLPPAPHVMEAMKKACEDPENYKYALADLPELLGAVAAHYKKRYGAALSRDEIMSVYGSQEGIAHIAFPLCNPGDTVIVTNPGYPVFSYGPILAGTELYSVPILKENNFLIDFDAIDEAAAKKAKLMIVS
jgi:LL-diaminopimelate aminotransferase